MSRPSRIELPTIFGMKVVNAYVFRDPEPVLVDCGENTKKNWEALEWGLGKKGLRIQDIKKVYITHAHVDHMGMAAKIAEETDADIWVSDLAYPWAVQLEEQWNMRLDTIKKLLNELSPPNGKKPSLADTFGVHFEEVLKVWDTVPKEKVKTFAIDGTLSLGGNSWQVVHAPGHCINQSCFYQAESQQLISADMLLSITPTPVIEMKADPPHEREKSLVQFISSLREFANMNIDRVYPGHYEAFGNPKNMIEKQLIRISIRKEACYELIRDGKHAFMDVFKAMYPKRLHSASLAMMVGYLDLLLDEGRIVLQKGDDGGNRYYVS